MHSEFVSSKCIYGGAIMRSCFLFCLCISCLLCLQEGTCHQKEEPSGQASQSWAQQNQNGGLCGISTPAASQVRAMFIDVPGFVAVCCARSLMDVGVLFQERRGIKFVCPCGLVCVIMHECCMCVCVCYYAWMCLCVLHVRVPCVLCTLFCHGFHPSSRYKQDLNSQTQLLKLQGDSLKLLLEEVSYVLWC